MVVQQMQEDIFRRMSGGETLEDVEDDIDSVQGVSSDQKAALWLYAWSLMPRRRQQYEARKWLRAVSSPQLGTD